MHNHNVREIDVSQFDLNIRQSLADSSKFGLDISSSDIELFLVVRILELHFVLIYELPEEITSDFEIFF